jgi:hypothetical protein
LSIKINSPCYGFDSFNQIFGLLRTSFKKQSPMFLYFNTILLINNKWIEFLIKKFTSASLAPSLYLTTRQSSFSHKSILFPIIVNTHSSDAHCQRCLCFAFAFLTLQWRGDMPLRGVSSVILTGLHRAILPTVSRFSTM